MVPTAQLPTFFVLKPVLLAKFEAVPTDQHESLKQFFPWLDPQ